MGVLQLAMMPRQKPHQAWARSVSTIDSRSRLNITPDHVILTPKMTKALSISDTGGVKPPHFDLVNPSTALAKRGGAEDSQHRMASFTKWLNSTSSSSQATIAAQRCVPYRLETAQAY